MMAYFDETVADGAMKLAELHRLDDDPRATELPVLHGKYLVSKTSGSSGKPSWVVQSGQDWARVRGAVFGRITKPWLTNRRLLGSLFRPLRVATLAADHALSMTWQTLRSADLSQRPFGTFAFFSVSDPDAVTAEGLNRFQPEYLHGYPTAMEQIARYKLRGGKCTFEPRLISVGSETMTEIAEDHIRRAFPTSVLINHYGLTECLQLSTSCLEGRLHVNSDLAILEPVNASGDPVSVGEFSDHILVTNLLNTTQPMIRYRVNDSVRWLDEPCPCGSPFPTIELHSRKGDLIYLHADDGDWKMLSPPIVVDIMLHTQGVAQYQVMHARQNELHVTCIPEPGMQPEFVASGVRHEFMTTLRRLRCADAVRLDVSIIDQFSRDTLGGKLLQMVSLVSPPETQNKPSPRTVSTIC